MMRFLFGLFVIGCVVWAGSRAVDHYFPSLSHSTAFDTPIGPVNWLLIVTVGLCVCTYKMLK